jgi:hypothetical protein
LRSSSIAHASSCSENKPSKLELKMPSKKRNRKPIPEAETLDYTFDKTDFMDSRISVDPDWDEDTSLSSADLKNITSFC